jgi:hypothetical protein
MKTRSARPRLIALKWMAKRLPFPEESQDGKVHSFSGATQAETRRAGGGGTVPKREGKRVGRRS